MSTKIERLKRKYCSIQGKPQYLGLIYPIRFCRAYDKRRMYCAAGKGACKHQPLTNEAH